MGSLCGRAVAALAGILLMAGLAFAGVATEVVVNKSIILNLKEPMQRVSIATPAIAELVVISPTQLQINGKKVGSTSLIVWDKSNNTSFFEVRVKGDGTVLEEQIREIAPNDSITVDYANDTIILRGKAANEVTVAKVVKLAQAYVHKIAEEMADKDEKTGAAVGLQNLASYTGSGNGNTVYGGSSDNIIGDAKNIYDASVGSEKMILPENKVLNFIEIADPQQVLLEVKVAQVNKTALKDVGLSVFARGHSGEGFSNLVGAPSGELTIRDASGGIISQAEGIAATHPGLAQFGGINNYQLGASFFDQGIGAVLKALVTKDLAKVLAEPNLLVKSGQEGKLHVGQKYPIQVLVSTNGVAIPSIRYEEVGIRLTFKPRVQENGIISLKIDPAEVSNIAGYLKDSNYPIIDTRKTQTSVQLKDGESLILAGLLNEQTRKQMTKVPILGDIPILGALFRSTKDVIEETELVFFITPKLVKPNAPGTDVELPTDKELTPKEEKELRWMPLG